MTPTDKPEIKTTRERLAAPGNTFDLRGYYLWVAWGKHGRTLMMRRGKDGQEVIDWEETRTVYASLSDPKLPSPGDHGRPHEMAIDIDEVHAGEVVNIQNKKRHLTSVLCRGKRRFVKR